MVPTSNELLHCVVVTVPLSLQVAPRLSAPACSKSWTVGGHLALVDGRWRSHELTAGVFFGIYEILYYKLYTNCSHHFGRHKVVVTTSFATVIVPHI